MWYRKQEIIKMDKQIERAGDDNKNNIGVLYGIGVGPGDPELMTLKAINTIKACDIIAIPAVSKEECYAYSIVQAVLPEIEKKTDYVHSVSHDKGQGEAYYITQ
mgnify:CR=1 FL=1